MNCDNNVYLNLYQVSF